MKWIGYSKPTPYSVSITEPKPAIPLLTAKSWAIFSPSYQIGKRETDRREIASLTKIMTAYTALSLSSRLDIDLMASKIEVSLDAAIIGGTSADLIEGDLLTVWDMFHGMLLPSGNDAAYSIAEYFGLLLIELGLPPLGKYTDPVNIFIAEMNKNAKSLGLNDTHFATPHGLPNSANKSTAMDIAKLAHVCMRNPLFRQIVGKQKYSCLGYDMDGDRKVFSWSNTNKLLGKGFDGVKTGITTTAGPCLTTSFETDGENVILVLLGSKTAQHRWSEMLKLKEYYLRTKIKGNEDGKSTSPKKVVRDKWKKPRSESKHLP